MPPGHVYDLSGGEAARDIIGKQENHYHGPTPQAINALPAPATGFSGRDREVAELLDAIDPRTDSESGGVPVSAVSGMGGIGKTALAAVVGNKALKLGLFAGALFVNLRGYDTDPATPAQALEALLRGLGVEGDRIPTHTHDRAILYRQELQAKGTALGGPMLVVADNASSEKQVEHLLPGIGGHRLLVTSRSELTGLTSHRIGLQVLSAQDSVKMLHSLLALVDNGDDRLEEEPEAALELAKACGGLPLALSVCVSLLNVDPDRPLSELVAELAEPADRFRILNHGRQSVTNLFDLAFKSLSTREAHLFILLGSAPGRSISTEAAAVLADVDELRVRSLLRRLSRAQLLERVPGSRRWTMHDLVADYARHRAGTSGSRKRRRALLRLLDHYDERATEAVRHMDALPGDQMPGRFSGHAEAITWLDSERDTLIDVVHTADRIHHSKVAIDLPIALSKYWGLRRTFTDAVTAMTISLETAQRTKDRGREAKAWSNLGLALAGLEREEEAEFAHRAALNLDQAMGHRSSEAGSWSNLGLTLRELDREKEAEAAFHTALTLYQAIGDSQGEGEVLVNLGNLLTGLDRLEEAEATLLTSLTFHQDNGDLLNEARVWNNLGNTYDELDRSEEAETAFRTALALLQKIGDHHHSAAQVWDNLGLLLKDLGRTEEARSAWERAVALYMETNDESSRAEVQGWIDDL